MPPTATMDDDVFRAFRNAGMSEEHAAGVAKVIPRRDEVATKADLADLRAAIPDRENFAAKSDVAVLQTEMTDVKAAIIRIDETLVRMDKRLDHLEKRADVTDEKINSIRTLLFAIFVPLHLLTLATLFGLLTRGILWAVAP
ncbi:MAG: hypothetical protein OXU94_02470 [Gammaproteobacteria bacterium]|nr:hypothetical protein [Gammaproteobacteria bacterium]